MKRLIAVLRRPQGIFALVSERTRPFSATDAGGTPPYGETLAPLAAVSESICPWKDKDVRAWRALASVPRLTERAGLAIVRTIIGSVADPDHRPAALREPDFGAGSVDLRPHLCNPAGEELLLRGLDQVLDAVTEAVEFPDWHWKGRQDIAALPAPFRRELLWGLHLSPWPQVLVTRAAFDALGLADDAPLRRAVARLLVHADRGVGIEWCDVLADLAPRRRARAVELVLESGAYARAPSSAARQILARDDGADAFAALSAQPRA